MTYFAGLDVSLKWTSVCVVDGDGQIVPEAKVLSEPDALVAFFAELSMDVTRICLEAGPLSQWLYDGLAEAGLPVVCAETRLLKAVLSATVNKSDRNDARGIAQMVRMNMIRPVHVKTMSSQHRRLLLTNRKWNGRLPPLMSEVERVGIDAHGLDMSGAERGMVVCVTSGIVRCVTRDGEERAD